jgi:type I restriction enzyme R subunit
MTEDQLEQETLAWLQDVGYTHRYGPDIAHDGPTPERASYRQVILSFRLREAIQRLNPGVPTAAREDALQRVLDLGMPALLAANRAFHRLLVGGVPVQYQKDGETVGDFVRLVDWSAPARNEFWAVNQFTIKGAHHTRRPDIVLFVNGLPLVLIELKNPADEAADIWKAWDQIQTYKAQIPDVFQTNELLVVSDGTEARMGSLSADAERFQRWRTIDGVALDPLGEFNELQTLVRGALAPATLLDVVRYFVLFEDDGGLVKKIAGYHQYHAVRAAIDQVVAASRPDSPARTQGKGGVVWHTQGSGKSITMTCFAARVMQEPAMENPTIVVITDRNDLDGQLFGVFSLAQDLLRETPVQASTRQELRQLLGNRPSGGIVFATIQKFMPGEDEDLFPVLSARRNIVVVADEAHRTQYGFEARLTTRKIAAGKSRAVATSDGRPAGPAAVAEFAPPDYKTSYQAGYAQHLRDALPNATFVAFTGTPGQQRRPRHPRRVRRLHPCLRHAAGQGRRRHRGDLLRVAPGQAETEGRRPAADRRRGGRAGRRRGRKQQASSRAAGRRWRRWWAPSPAHGQRGRRSGGAFRGTQPGAGRQGHGGGHEPRHLRAPVQRHRRAAPRLAQRRPGARRNQDHHDRQRQRQSPAAPAPVQQPDQKAAGKALQRPRRPAAPGHRAGHVADRL